MPVLVGALATIENPVLVLSLLINSFHKLSDNQRHALDALYLLLCSHQLPLQAPTVRQHISRSPGWGFEPLLILDIFLLQLDVPEHPLAVARQSRTGYSLQVPLKLLQGRVFIRPVCAYAFQRIYIRY